MPQPGFTYPEEYYNTRSAEAVLAMLVQMFHPASVLDVGCGNGSWLTVAKQLGIGDVLGVDLHEELPQSWPLEARAYRRQDLSQPFDLGRQFDLILCLEVAEHLPPEAAETLVESLARHGSRIVFSAAIPRQGGEGHIHEKEPGYWQALFNQRGYRTFDDIRPRIWSNQTVCWWYRQNMFLAIREELSGARLSEVIPHLVHPELFWETSGFRILAEYRLQEMESRERVWHRQDGSIRYHIRRAWQLAKKRLFPPKQQV